MNENANFMSKNNVLQLPLGVKVLIIFKFGNRNFPTYYNHPIMPSSSSSFF